MQEFLFGSIFLVLIISGIFSFFEIAFIRIFFEIKSTKYIKLLKIFELITPFIALINPKGTGKIAGRVLPIFFLLSLTYFIVLVYDFFKGKIDENEFIINFIFYFLTIFTI